jgi:CheY-like chemotaxis protein
LFQSVRELLINAAKHSESHDAWVSFQQHDGELKIVVRDHGKGFDLAAASNASIANKFGLYNIRERMQALGGTLELDSASRKGTIATLTLPLQIVQTKVQEYAETKHKVRPADKARYYPQPDFDRLGYAESAVRVLLVDDHAMVRQGLRSLLECHTDIEVVGEASDGEEGLVLVEQLRPAIVIMDINMPKMNGIQATAKIKERYPVIKVIGLSVNTNTDNQQAMRSAGAELLLTKEAAVEQLYAGIQEIQRH